MKKNKYAKLTKLNSRELKEYIEKVHRKTAVKLPAYIYKNFDIDEIKEGGCTCYRMIPKNGFNGTYIVYLYGSSMCNYIDDEQWNFITRLSEDTNTALFVPMYPVAPEHCCRETFDVLQRAYGNITKSFDVEKVVLMGDSSGAGLALSLAIVAWKEGLRKPDQLVLLSSALDTEFFDYDMELRMHLADHRENNLFFTDGVKQFLNEYWVKDYAAKTEYTSPYYEDYTDLCDDVVLFSGVDDMLNCYSREFYNKAKAQGVNVRFFEFENECHDFMIYSKSYESANAYGYLKDVINCDYKNSLRELYPIKMRCDWAKKHPDVIQDEWDAKFIQDKKFDFSKVIVRMSEYKNLILMANTVACESKIKKFILQYPNCTIVCIGCRLENTFASMDNGRIQWYNVDTHNIMSVRRALYGEREREKTVGRSLMDFSWVEDINCVRDHGVMFVCQDAFSYMSKQQVKSLVEILLNKFPGSELVFTASTSGAVFWDNHIRRSYIGKKRKLKLSVDDAQKMFGAWRSDYHVMGEEPVTKYIGKLKKLKPVTYIGLWYNKITYNHRIIHVKLGNEEYVVKV